MGVHDEQDALSGEIRYTVKDPRVIEAEINKLNKEADLFEAQTVKERWIGKQHELAAAESERTWSTVLASNSENRVYDFLGQVTQHSVEICMAILGRWRRMSKEPIVIRISSPGGSMIDGFALYDYIQSLRSEGIYVTTAVLGMAASMAGILLQAGDRRVIGPNAHVLIHEASSGASGKLSDLEDETKFIRRLNDRSFDILAARSSMTRAAIETRAKRKDWWLPAEEVVKLGLADEIGYAG